MTDSTTRFRTRRALLKTGLVLAAASAAAGAALRLRDPRAAGELRFGGEVMGSYYDVRFVAPLAEARLHEAARDAVDAALADVDRRMSTFKPDSEVSRLNRHRMDAPFTLSEETFALLAAARATSEASAGAFDVTAGPLVNAWGFGPGRDPRIPSAAERAELRERVGFRLLELDARGRAARKAHPRMYVDLSGIAKGHGVDRAASALEALGIADYVIEVGGEVRARGRNFDGRPWRVAIEEPQPGPRRVRRVLALADRAMATSGDYRIYFVRAGRRYCHEIDPSRGEPVSHSLTSVSVVAPDCASADAMATALMVLGPRQGYAMAARGGIAAYFIERTAGGLADRATPAYLALG
ncbi:MAG TPA: FAD:protein FMN transferase [Usitatibacter sp.]|nr:FAD:protein FMN transferase [Usitatibacter sp.]